MSSAFADQNPGHCGGGEGAFAFGQQGVEVTILDPQHNVLLSIVDWVENGNAPETITGTKYVNVGLLKMPR
jgi:feruloyl esterase